MKAVLHFKGNFNSGNYGHKGRPGLVGGSSKQLTTYSNMATAIQQWPDKKAVTYEFILAPNGDVLSLTNTKLGGHTSIARRIMSSKKYAADITLDMSKKLYAADTFLVKNGFTRVLYERNTKILNFELRSLTKSVLEKLQNSLEGSTDVDFVWLESYEKPYGVLHNLPFAEFMASTKIQARAGDIELKHAV